MAFSEHTRQQDKGNNCRCMEPRWLKRRMPSLALDECSMLLCCLTDDVEDASPSLHAGSGTDAPVGTAFDYLDLWADDEAGAFTDSEHVDMAATSESLDTRTSDTSRTMPRLPPRPEKRTDLRPVPLVAREATAASSGPSSKANIQLSLSCASEAESRQRALENMPVPTPRPLADKCQTRGRFPMRVIHALRRGNSSGGNKDVVAELAAGWRQGHGVRLRGGSERSLLDDRADGPAPLHRQRSAPLEVEGSKTDKRIRFMESRGVHTKGAFHPPAESTAPSASTKISIQGIKGKLRLPKKWFSGRKGGTALGSIMNSARSRRWWTFGKAGREPFLHFPDNDDTSDVITADITPLGEPESPRSCSESSDFDSEDML